MKEIVHKIFNKNVGNAAKNALLVLASCIIIGININSFVNAAGLYPGGFSGITLLIQRIGKTYFDVEVPYSAIYYALNFVILIFSARFLGRRFAIYTILTVLLTGFFADFIPTITITSDPLLSCVFGGLINGAAIALCLLANSSGGGTDIVGMLIADRYHVDPWNYILFGNVVILLIAGILFDWNQALYSIIFQFCTTQTLQLLYRKHQQHTLFIVTDKATLIYNAIQDLTNHGGTLIHGEGLYKNEERDLVYSVISSMEVKPVLKAIRQLDEDAFINVVKTDQLNGRFYQS